MTSSSFLGYLDPEEPALLGLLASHPKPMFQLSGPQDPNSTGPKLPKNRQNPEDGPRNWEAQGRRKPSALKTHTDLGFGV